MTGDPPEVLVVIVNYGTADLTLACLASLERERAAGCGLRVAVVENASGDGPRLAAAIRGRGWGDWVSLDAAERNGGFSYGNNRAIRAALASPDPPKYVLLLNSDTEVRPGAVGTLAEFLDANPGAGMAGSSFENPDGSDWPIAFRFVRPLSELERGLRFGPATHLLSRFVVHRVMDQSRPQRVDWVAGASLMIRREVFESVGLMDEGYFLYYEEVDFCLRASRAGWPCWYVPASRVMHIAGQSTGLTLRAGPPARTPQFWYESRRRYFLKHFGRRGLLVADLGFAAGFAAWRLRRAVTRRPDPDPPGHLGDFVRFSIRSAIGRRRLDASDSRERGEPSKP